jgi:hypothetical protein
MRASESRATAKLQLNLRRGVPGAGVGPGASGLGMDFMRKTNFPAMATTRSGAVAIGSWMSYFLFTRVMLHLGHLPGLSDNTSGCIEQV